MADEAYTLVVEPNSILLQASSEAGLFYAKEALLQLSRFGTFAGVENKGCCAIIGNTNRSNRVLR